MIVYSATKADFRKDVKSNCIDEKILQAFQKAYRRKTGVGEIEAWRNSMQYMGNVLDDKDIPENAGIYIEYGVPQQSKRIDFIITGKNGDKEDTVVIIELKQWAEAEQTNKDAIVSAFYGKGVKGETWHPSYQAWSYAMMLHHYNETVRNENIQLRPCAYLHNCISHDVINNSFYKEYTDQAPAFLKSDSERLKKFIKSFIRYGDPDNIMYRIDNGRIKPSKNLADRLVSLLEGNREFILIDDQKLAYETALELAASPSEPKNVLIIVGGPGTGKSVIAINLLVELTKREKSVQYVTKNAAPRAVYEAKLTGHFRRSYITNLFKGSGSYVDCEKDTFDVLVVDESHRLNEKSGMMQNKGENQIKEIINAARTAVFFIDEDQRVTLKDIGDMDEIMQWARKAGANVYNLQLQSQFRCNGSDGYLAWLDHALQIRETANYVFDKNEYNFRVFDSPNDLKDLIFKKNCADNKARLVAGYCWDWVSKGDSDPFIKDIDIKEHNFAMKWNLADDGGLWLIKPESVNEVGCIHTCQGLELDYIGVIIGPDLVVRDGKIITDASKRSKNDSSVRGYKSLLKKDPEFWKSRIDTIIKNTYRTLMTRGTKGCYIFCTDKETSEYFKALAKQSPIEPVQPAEPIAKPKYPGLSLPILDKKEVKPYVNSVPIYDLKIAAGKFGDKQYIDETDHDWVLLPDTFRIQPGLFVAQVVGESMNRRIPNRAWCLFKLNPVGTRQGKVVVAQHKDIQDLDTGAEYTVKVYESQKLTSEDDPWEHRIVILRPDSNNPNYKSIEIKSNEKDELKIIAELVAIL